MSLINGLDELRTLITEPTDPLFNHLTDLMLALEEVSGCPNNMSRIVTKQKRIKRPARPHFNESFPSHSIVESAESNVNIAIKPAMLNLEQTDSEKDASGHNAHYNTNPSMMMMKQRRRHGQCSIWRLTVTPPHALTTTVSTSTSCSLPNNNNRTRIASAATPKMAIPTASSSASQNPLQKITTAAGAPIESDSFTEMLTPARRCRKKRLVKRMAVDPADEPGCSSWTYRRSSGSMDVDVRGLGTSAANYNVAGSLGHSFMSEETCCPDLIAARAGLNVAKKKRIAGFSAFKSDNSMECEVCCTGSSESDWLGNSDDGHQGDDEQSDWYFEHPTTSSSNKRTNNQSMQCDNYDDNSANLCNDDSATMGVPNLRKIMKNKLSQQQATGLNSYIQALESSDTDISQQSWTRARGASRFLGKRLWTKNTPSMSGALNRRIVNFLDNQPDSELHLGTLKKRERREVLRLASFYDLSICCRTSRGVQTYSLVKNKYTAAR